MTQTIIDKIPEDIEIIMPQDQDTYKTKTGVTLKLKRVSPLLMADASRALVEPRVPQVANLDKEEDGSVLEDNPADPDYIAAMNQYRQQLSDLSSAIYLTRGTVPERPLPDGVPDWEDSEWSADIEDIAQIRVPALGKRRYWAWLKYIVLEDLDDFSDLLRAIMRRGGITMEADVAQATTDFRSDEEGDTSEGLRTEEGSGLGNTDRQLALLNGSAGD